MASPRSMTGFGAAEVALADGTVRVEVRAVNHRHLDVRVRVAPELTDHASLIEETVRALTVRGRIEVSARLEAPASSGAYFDAERVQSVYADLCALRDRIAPNEPLPLSAVLGIPGLFAARNRGTARDHEAEIKAATTRACQELQAMRSREGEALVADLRQRLGILSTLASEISAQRSSMLDGVRLRLIKRIEKLLEGSGIEPDSSKIAQEIAWFAERSDIAEELTRLASHLAEFERTLDNAADSVGKKLDFLLQELGREVNTIGSKANDASLSHRVVEMKAELERLREQVQNLL